MKQLVTVIILNALISYSFAQNLVERSFTLEKTDQLVLSNLCGGIDVKTHNSDKIIIHAQLLEGEIPDIMSLEAVSNDNITVCYFKTPCNTLRAEFFENADLEIDNIFNDRNNCHWAAGVEMPVVEYEVFVPKNQNVYASSIMEGDITVRDVIGTVCAQNIDGDVELIKVHDVDEATTINGDVDLEYIDKPVRDAIFHTINGDINVKTNAGLDADVLFKSFNGNFYTDLDPKDVAAPEKMIQQNDKNGFKMKVDKRKLITFNKGGVSLSFETFNGDAYLVSN